MTQKIVLIPGDIYITKTQKQFNEVEEAGSEITYRYINCHAYKTCKDHDQIETASIKEEVEQDMINQSVHVDLKQRQTIANLPLIHDPAIKLHPNKTKALKVYNQQLKKLNKQPQDIEQIIQSRKNLQDLGRVKFTCNLPKHLQIMLKYSSIEDFTSWRIVWKANSVSTPSRLVFYASQIFNTGYSLNDILAKGRNLLKLSLGGIFIRLLSILTSKRCTTQSNYMSKIGTFNDIFGSKT